jgi:hypothetical protein
MLVLTKPLAVLNYTAYGGSAMLQNQVEWPARARSMSTTKCNNPHVRGVIFAERHR